MKKTKGIVEKKIESEKLKKEKKAAKAENTEEKRVSPSTKKNFELSPEAQEDGRRIINELKAKKKPSNSRQLVILFAPNGSGKAFDVDDSLYKDFGMKSNDTVLISNEKFMQDFSVAKSSFEECKKYIKTLSELPTSGDSDNTLKNCINAQMKHGNEIWKAVFHTLLDDCVNAGFNILFDSSGRSTGMIKGKLIPMAKAAGYKIKVVYPICENERMYERVLDEARKTGFVVEKSFIDQLHESAQKNIADLYDVVDELYIFDNNDKPKAIMTLKNGKLECDLSSANLGAKSADFVEFINSKCGKGGSAEDCPCGDKTGRGEDSFIVGGDSFIVGGAGIIGGCAAAICTKKVVILVIIVILIIVVLNVGEVSKFLAVSEETVLTLCMVSAGLLAVCVFMVLVN